MDVLIRRRKTESPAPENSGKLAPPTPYDKRYGEWGRVELLHSEDNTVDISLDIGVYLKRVQVSSREWVVPGKDADKDYDSGERDLPPKNARVFVMMPTGTLNDCFVLCSGFAGVDQPKPYMEEGREKIKERFTPSRWHGIHNYETGSIEIASPDEKTRFKIDYGTEEEPLDPPEFHAELFQDGGSGIKLDAVSGKRADLNAFDEFKASHNTEEKTLDVDIFEDAEMRFKKGESAAVRIFDEAAFTHKKGVSISGEFFDGEAGFTHQKGVSTVIKAFDSEITLIRGKVVIKTSGMIEHDVPVYKFNGNTSVGMVTPKGSGVYCAIPVCPFSGLPQTG
jgi:hypothetical protein